MNILVVSAHPDDEVLDTLPQTELPRAIEALISTHQPATIYTHHFGDMTPPYPHPRSLEAIENHARSCGSGVGVEYVEPSMLIRNLPTRQARLT